MTSYAFLGIAAGVLDFATSAVYIRSILKGSTKPNRVTWWVLFIVSFMVTVSYYAAGARETIWVPVAYTVGFFITAVLSVRYGEGSFRLTLIDKVSLLGALLSGIVWWLMQSPIPALLMNICTEFIGVIPTIYKSYHRPWTEDLFAWSFGTVAAVLNFLAIREWSLEITAYPAYILLTDIVILTFLIRGRLLKKA